MVAAGAARRQLTRTLNEAFTTGLISDRTFAWRLDRVLRASVLDPHELVGDLHLRPAGDRGVTRLGHTLATIASRLELLVSRGDPRPPMVLALDWSGDQQRLVIGRSSGCEVVLGDSTVSRRHARLSYRGGRWILQDLASTNGTILNGTRVGRCELRPGDELLLGHARLRVD